MRGCAHPALVLGTDLLTKPLRKADLVRDIWRILVFAAAGMRRAAAQTETGTAFSDRPTWTAHDLPFGGVKDSGHGPEPSGVAFRRS